MLKRAVILMGLLVPAQALAQSVPDYPIEPYCEYISQVGGGSYVIKNGCIDMEQSAKATLKNMSIPERIRQYCDQIATLGTGSDGSYDMYLSCVQMELQAKGG